MLLSARLKQLGKAGVVEMNDTGTSSTCDLTLLGSPSLNIWGYQFDVLIQCSLRTMADLRTSALTGLSSQTDISPHAA
jgi:hypothetical protein